MDSFTPEQRALFDKEMRALRIIMQQLKANGFESKAKRAAQMAYHPDKNSGHRTVFTELFKILNDFIDRKGEEKQEQKPQQPDGDFEDFDDDAWARGEEEAEEADEGDEDEFDSRADFARAHPDLEDLYERELGGGQSKKRKKKSKHKARKKPRADEKDEAEEGKNDEECNAEQPVSDFEQQHIAYSAIAKRREFYAFAVVRLPPGADRLHANRGAVRVMAAQLTTVRVGDDNLFA